MISSFLPAAPAQRRQALRFLIVLGLVAAAALTVVVTCYGEWSDATTPAIRAGKKPRLDHVVQVWVWRGLLVDAVLALGLCLTVRWWVGRVGSGEAPPGAGHRFWLLAAGILLLAAGVRAPRLGLSFYNDETHNFMRMTAGELRHTSAANDEFLWDQARWVETLWFNGAGNNSQPHSVLSRLTYETWKSLAGGVDGEVCEWAVRLPALAAGMTSLLVLGLAVREWAGMQAASFTMLAGAVHGWHVRYSTEARGYSLMILGLSLMLYCGQRALKHGRWRDWLGYAFANFLAFWAFPGSAYFLLVLNLGVVMHLLWQQSMPGIKREQLTRFSVAGLLAVLVMLPLMLPLIPQLLNAVNKSSGLKGTMDSSWWQNMTGHLLWGCRWGDADESSPHSIAVARMLAESGFWWAAVFVSGGVVVLGLARMVGQGGMLRLFAVASVLAVFLSWGDMARQGRFLNFWYATFALPAVFCAAGLGIAGLVRLANRWGCMQWLAGAALVALSMGVAGRVTFMVMHRSKGDERAAVLQVRGAIYPHYQRNPEAIRPLLGVVWSNASIYDPLSVVVHEPATLEVLKQRAAVEKRPLYVVLGHRQSALGAQPETVRQLEGPGFECVGLFRGLDEEYYAQRLFRMLP